MRSMFTTLNLMAAGEVEQDRSIFIRDCISQVISAGPGESQPQGFAWIDQLDRSAGEQSFEAPGVGLWVPPPFDPAPG